MSHLLLSQNLSAPPPSSPLLSLFLSSCWPLGTTASAQCKQEIRVHMLAHKHTVRGTHARPHTHTQSPYSLKADHANTNTKSDPLCGRCILCVCFASLALLLLPLGKNIKTLRGLGALLHRSNRGVWGPARLSDSHPV